MRAFPLVCVEENGCLPLRVKRTYISFRYPRLQSASIYMYVYIYTHIDMNQYI